jgi:hypothetical protein
MLLIAAVRGMGERELFIKPALDLNDPVLTPKRDRARRLVALGL